MTAADVWSDTTPAEPEAAEATPASTPPPAARRTPANGQTGDRPPPHDDNAERAVLGALILRPDLVDAVDQIIRDDDWYRLHHRLIYDTIVDRATHHQPVDTITIAAAIGTHRGLSGAGGPLYINELANDPNVLPDQATWHAGIIAARAHERRTVELGTKLVQAGHTGTDDDTVRRMLELHIAQRGRNSSPAGDTRMIKADAWLFDQPDTIDALWGNADDILWARGETLLIAGPSGVGKTTLGQQLTLARLGILRPDLLGLPIERAPRGLYLAMDRPAQARRAFRRTVRPENREQVGNLTVWKGPPPAQVVTNPRILLDLARKAGLSPGDFVVVDSVKDVAIGIAKDEVGAAVNMALQELLAAEIDVLALHHIRKADHAGVGKEPTSIDEIYGSSHIVNGAGSVITLWGAPGDPIVSFKHHKQPATQLGPWRLIHDHDHGRTDIWHDVDLLQLVKGTGQHGLTAQAAAHTLFGITEGTKPTSSQQEKARRKLERYVKDGLLVRHGGTKGRPTATSDQARYYLAAHADALPEGPE